MSLNYRPLRFTEIKNYTETKYPWYRERLQLKYFKKNGVNPKFLFKDDWSFLRNCSDDFRDGYPSSIDHSEWIIKGKGSLFPNIYETREFLKEPLQKTGQSKFPKRFSKTDVVYSKSTPLKIQRKYNIEEIELGLVQHPLALYSHLESSVLPEIFEEIVDIVDPDMNISICDNEDVRSTDSVSSHSIKSSGIKKTLDEFLLESPHTSDEADRLPLNYFKWVFKKEEKDKKNRVQNEQNLKMMAENEHIKNVTKEFCNWVAGLGGQATSIEEPTVTSLFASGYETKPTLSVPIHVMELTSIPPELRGNVSAQAKIDEDNDSDQESINKIYKSSYGDFEKFRYGAWYLPSKFWRKMPASEKLQDPKLVCNHKQEEHRDKVLALNTELAHLQGPKLFNEFIEKAGKRKPQFLNEVAEIQHQFELEKNIGKE